MNKNELAREIATKTNTTIAGASGVINAFTDIITEQLQQGNKVNIVGFGCFSVTERAAREGRNPQTGDAMEIPAMKTPKFKAGKSLKNIVKNN